MGYSLPMRRLVRIAAAGLVALSLGACATAGLRREGRQQRRTVRGTSRRPSPSSPRTSTMQPTKITFVLRKHSSKQAPVCGQ